MAITVTDVDPVKNRPEKVGQHLERTCDIKFDAAYVTGGLAYSPALLGFRKVFGIDILGAATAGAAGKVMEVDLVNSKLLLRSGALAEVGNGSDQSGVTMRCVVRGL